MQPPAFNPYTPAHQALINKWAEKIPQLTKAEYDILALVVLIIEKESGSKATHDPTKCLMVNGSQFIYAKNALFTLFQKSPELLKAVCNTEHTDPNALATLSEFVVGPTILKNPRYNNSTRKLLNNMVQDVNNFTINHPVDEKGENTNTIPSDELNRYNAMLPILAHNPESLAALQAYTESHLQRLLRGMTFAPDSFGGAEKRLQNTLTYLILNKETEVIRDEDDKIIYTTEVAQFLQEQYIKLREEHRKYKAENHPTTTEKARAKEVFQPAGNVTRAILLKENRDKPPTAHMYRPFPFNPEVKSIEKVMMHDINIFLSEAPYKNERQNHDDLLVWLYGTQNINDNTNCNNIKFLNVDELTGEDICKIIKFLSYDMTSTVDIIKSWTSPATDKVFFRLMEKVLNECPVEEVVKVLGIILSYRNNKNINPNSIYPLFAPPLSKEKIYERNIERAKRGKRALHVMEKPTKIKAKNIAECVYKTGDNYQIALFSQNKEIAHEIVKYIMGDLNAIDGQLMYNIFHLADQEIELLREDKLPKTPEYAEVHAYMDNIANLADKLLAWHRDYENNKENIEIQDQSEDDTRPKKPTTEEEIGAFLDEFRRIEREYRRIIARQNQQPLQQPGNTQPPHRGGHRPPYHGGGDRSSRGAARPSYASGPSRGSL